MIKEKPSVESASTLPRLRKDEFGQLFCDQDGKSIAVDVAPCFPWSQPGQYLSIKEIESGEELYLIESLENQLASTRSALELYLLEKGFYFQVTKLIVVREEFELRHWHVETAQGERLFQTKLMDWPTILESGGVCVKDLFGDLYVIESVSSLDTKSRKLLDPFLD